MPIADPDQLITAFKGSGEFDKLRRELVGSAQRSSGFDAFKARITEIARERLESGQMAYTAPEMLHKVARHELRSFTILERFAKEVPMISDSAFKDGIRTSLQRILLEDRRQNVPPPAPFGGSEGHADPSQPSLPIPPDTDASARQGEEPPILPNEPGVVPLVPRVSPPEARLNGNKYNTAPDTVDSSPIPMDTAS
ncbi:hypothetical protein GGX14DRAFT_416230, partial [Mycena pura]